MKLHYLKKRRAYHTLMAQLFIHNKNSSKIFECTIQCYNSDMFHHCIVCRDGYHYIPCRKKPDDSEEGLVTEMTYHPTIFGNGVFQDMDDVS